MALRAIYQLYDHAPVHFLGTLITIYGDKINTNVSDR